jgi:hypothetical protein
MAQPHTPETKDRVKQLYAQGHNADEIAGQLNMTRAQIDGLIYRLKLRRPPPYGEVPEPLASSQFPDWQPAELVDWREWFSGWDRILESYTNAPTPTNSSSP